MVLGSVTVKVESELMLCASVAVDRGADGLASDATDEAAELMWDSAIEAADEARTEDAGMRFSVEVGPWTENGSPHDDVVCADVEEMPRRERSVVLRRFLRRIVGS